MKILILDAHSNAALAVLQSLGRAGHDVFLAGSSSDVISWYSKYSKRKYVYPDPLKAKSEFKNWLVDLQRKNCFKYIVPVTDNTIYPLMELRRQFGGYKEFVIPCEETFSAAFEKDVTGEIADKLGINVPASYIVVDNNLDLESFKSFPYFVKAVSSKVWEQDSGCHLEPRFVRDFNELKNAVAKFVRFGNVLIQEHVCGDGIGIEVLCRSGEVVLVFAHKRIHEYPITGGGSTYRVSIAPPKELMNAAIKILREIKWHGVAMVEFKQKGEDYWLMEINGRFWGSLPLAISVGVDFPVELINMLSNDKYEVPRKDYKLNIYSRKVSSDLVWFKANLKADKKDLFLMTRGVMSSFFELFRVFTGKETWDNASWRDPRPILNEIRKVVLKEFHIIKVKIIIKVVLHNAKKQSLEKIRKIKPKRILILCYGNICRSPFVELYLKKLLIGDNVEIKSSGFHEVIDRGSPDKIIKAAKGNNIDLSAHRSSIVTPKMLKWADLIVIMDEDNWKDLLDLDNSIKNKIVWLGAFLSSSIIEIEDPYLKSEDEVDVIIKKLIQSAEGLVEHIKKI